MGIVDYWFPCVGWLLVCLVWFGWLTFSKGGRNKQVENVLKALPTLPVDPSELPVGMIDIGAGIWMLPPDPNVPWLYMNDPGPLFIRECARKLCDESVFPALESRERRGFVVSGTPGIGKSVLTNWFLAGSLSRSPDRPIYLIDWQIPQKGTLIAKNSVRTLLDEPDFVGFDQNLLYIADTGGDPKPRDKLKCNGVSVVFASPAAIPREFLNKAGNTELCFLPPWSWEECEATWRVLSKISPDFIDHEELERRFAFAGGIPRCLFGNQSVSNRYEALVNDAISGITTQEALSLSQYNIKKAVHKVLHTYPSGPHGKFEYKYPSTQIQQRIEKHLLECSDHEASRTCSMLLQSGLSINNLQVTVGHIFEASAHRFLARGGRFMMKRMKERDLEGKESVPRFRVIAETLEVFLDSDKEGLTKERCLKLEQSELKEGVYYEPTQENHPGVDSWFVHRETDDKIVVYFFQMTLADSKTLKEVIAKMVTFAKVRLGANCTVRVVFVVPKVEKKFEVKIHSSPPSACELWQLELASPLGAKESGLLLKQEEKE